MNSTYKAVEVSAPNTLRVVERPIPEPKSGQVRIRVEACGICHTDAATVTGAYPGLQLPRVPGHEVVGRNEALGSAYPNGNSVNASVSVSSAAKTACVSPAAAETL
jgi:propanol-preferring alcohol dehydrogenase